MTKGASRFYSFNATHPENKEWKWGEWKFGSEWSHNLPEKYFIHPPLYNPYVFASPCSSVQSIGAGIYSKITYGLQVTAELRAIFSRCLDQLEHQQAALRTENRSYVLTGEQTPCRNTRRRKREKGKVKPMRQLSEWRERQADDRMLAMDIMIQKRRSVPINGSHPWRIW